MYIHTRNRILSGSVSLNKTMTYYEKLVRMRADEGTLQAS